MERDKALINFKKTKSLLEKIIKMTEDGDYCIDIMQQNLAAIGMLRSAHQKLMEGHLNHCFINAVDTKNKAKKQKMVDEILTVTRLYNK